MVDLKGKKLLLLAGAPVHCKVVEAAKEMGVYVIVTDYLPYEQSPAKQIADEYWDLNITQIDEIAKRCKEENVDGVLNFCIDPAQRPYQQICEKTGYYCYGNKEQFHILTDKIAFKNFCRQTGVDTIKEYSETDVTNNTIDYPVFVKPVDSRGSRGQTVCNNKNELLEAIEIAKSESSDGNYIIEQYMFGKQDFTMTYLVKDKIPYLIRLGDRYLGTEEDKLNKQCTCLVCPSNHKDLYINKVDQKVKKFIKELGVENGPVFMQGFIDDEVIRFYDPGLRFPGGEYEALLKRCTGANIMKMLVEFAITGKMDNYNCLKEDLFELNGLHTVQLPITAKPGTVKVFDGLGKIQKEKNVVSVFKRYDVGETVPQSGDVRQRICEIAFVVDKNESVSDIIKNMQSSLTVLDENMNNMLTSLVDPTILKY